MIWASPDALPLKKSRNIFAPILGDAVDDTRLSHVRLLDDADNVVHHLQERSPSNIAPLLFSESNLQWPEKIQRDMHGGDRAIALQVIFVDLL
jgi:hypothetical protein